MPSTRVEVPGVAQQGGHGRGGEAVPGLGNGAGTVSDECFASVWDAIEDTPAAAENLKLRSALMIALKEQIEHQGWTQVEAARRFGVTQPRVSDLMPGRAGHARQHGGGGRPACRNAPCRCGVSKWAGITCPRQAGSARP